MRKINIGLFTIGLLAISIAAQAQKIGKIKNKAKQSSSSRKSDRRSSGSGGSSNSGSDSGFNGAACFDGLMGCLDLLIAITPDSPPDNNRSQTYKPLSTKEKPPARVEPTPPPPPPVTVKPTPPTPTLPPLEKSAPRNYFQLKASYGFLPNNYEVFRPGVRVRLGKKHGFGMAFDYRYNFLREKVLGEYTSYFTHDIQLLQFAPETKGDVEIRVGFGLMVDEFQEFYPEILAGFNALADQTKWNFGSEFRFAPNNASGGRHPARLEWGAHVQYALVNQPKFKLYGGLRSKVAKYFGEDIWSIGLGLNMRIY